MQVVLLAAGLGSRLGSLTETVPKALIRVGGEPLIEHALHFAARLIPTSVVVVGGFGFPQVAEEIERIRSLRVPPLELVENTSFRDGNLVSLMTARPYLVNDFLICRIDVLDHGIVVQAAVDHRTAGDEMLHDRA